jgi:hypothetical protein
MKLYSSQRALVIGIQHYANPQYDLSYARHDAEAVAEVLQGEFGFESVWTLYDHQATRQNIIRSFEQDLQATDENDGLLIFFAGHGITVTSAIGNDEGYLVPHDGNFNPRQPNANLSLTRIRDEYLSMIPAKHIFLIVDACYGGLAVRDVGAVKIPDAIDDPALIGWTRSDRKVRQILAAGTKDQRVLDGGLYGHSIFTGRLIEALREANPYITAAHLGVHVSEQVARDAHVRKHRQSPQFGHLGGDEGQFVFRRNATEKPPPPSPSPPPPSNKEELKIDSSPVSWKQFLDFMEAGTYSLDGEKLALEILELIWTEKGLAWLRSLPAADRKPSLPDTVRNASIRVRSQMPVTGVSWFDAIAYCNWMTICELKDMPPAQLDRMMAYRFDGDVSLQSGYRLLTEEEFRKNYSQLSGQTSGTKGDTQEWLCDRYIPEHLQKIIKPSRIVDSSDKLVRRHDRSRSRYGIKPWYRGGGTTFRCVLPGRDP